MWTCEYAFSVDTTRDRPDGAWKATPGGAAFIVARHPSRREVTQLRGTGGLEIGGVIDPI